MILGAYATAALTPELTVFVRPDYVFNSKRYTSANNLAWIGNDVTLNFRMGVAADNWTVTGYVRNVLDDDTPIAALDFVNFGDLDVNYPIDSDGQPEQRPGSPALLPESEARTGHGASSCSTASRSTSSGLRVCFQAHSCRSSPVSRWSH